MDDVCALFRSREDAIALHRHLNTVHPSLKFELELPDQTGQLSLLDVSIRISAAGEVDHSWYTKKANKGIKLHSTSHVPGTIKLNTIVNEHKRVKDLSSNSQEQAKAVKDLQKTFRRNGYEQSYLGKLDRTTRNLHSASPRPAPIAVNTMVLPFVSDEFTRKIRRALKAAQLDVQVRVQPGLQLRHLLKKVAYPRSCSKRNCPVQDDALCFRHNVVYRMTCELCNAFYIGSTTRCFHERASEHLRAARNPSSYPRYAIAAHYREQHAHTAPRLKFNMVAQHKSELDCRIAEATIIDREQPQLNQKAESDFVYAALLIA